MDISFFSRLPIIQGGCHKFIPAIAALMALPIWQCPDLAPRNVTEGNMTVLKEWTVDQRTEIWRSRMREVNTVTVVSARGVE